jgi:hypothetical protein
MERYRMKFCLFLLSAFLCCSAQSATIELSFSFENDGILNDAAFGSVGISQDQTNRLAFEVAVDTSIMGDGADISAFGFNLDYDESIQLISGTNTATLIADARVGGRNSIFDYVVDFGRGQPFFDSVEFVIEGNGLTLSALSNVDLSTQNNKPDAQFMAHVQSTSTLAGSESIGGVVTPVPVPAAVWLFGSALGLLGWMRHKTV